MQFLLAYAAAFFGAGIIGVISAAIVLGIGWLLNRYVAIRMERTFLLAGSIGVTLWLTGEFLDNRMLVAASMLLWGWVVIPILSIPPFLAWQCVSWIFSRAIPSSPPKNCDS